MKAWKFRTEVFNGRFWTPFDINVTASNLPTALYRVGRELNKLTRPRRPKMQKFIIKLVSCCKIDRKENATNE
jgi:hypothetical protein